MRSKWPSARQARRISKPPSRERPSASCRSAPCWPARHIIEKTVASVARGPDLRHQRGDRRDPDARGLDRYERLNPTQGWATRAPFSVFIRKRCAAVAAPTRHGHHASRECRHAPPTRLSADGRRRHGGRPQPDQARAVCRAGAVRWPAPRALHGRSLHSLIDGDEAVAIACQTLKSAADLTDRALAERVRRRRPAPDDDAGGRSGRGD